MSFSELRDEVDFVFRHATSPQAAADWLYAIEERAVLHCIEHEATLKLDQRDQGLVKMNPSKYINADKRRVVVLRAWSWICSALQCEHPGALPDSLVDCQYERHCTDFYPRLIDGSTGAVKLAAKPVSEGVQTAERWPARAQFLRVVLGLLDQRIGEGVTEVQEEFPRRTDQKPASWFERKTDHGLYPAKLRMALNRERISGAKIGNRLYYSVASVAAFYPQYAAKLIASEPKANKANGAKN